MAQVIWNTDIDVYNRTVIPLLIARSIANYLPIQDLLSFSLISKNAHEAVNDPTLWVSILKEMGVWDHARQVTKEDIRKNAKMPYLDSPLTCLDYVYRSLKNAKYQTLKIHKCLFRYYNDLLVTKSYDNLKLLKDFQTPEDQAKILTNLLSYNRVDHNEESRALAHDKLSDLFEQFENTLLRELEIHFDVEDYEQTKRFVLILVSLNNQQTLIDFFLQKSIFDEDMEMFGLTPLNIDDYFANQCINTALFDDLIANVALVFNKQCEIIDKIFPQSIPMMYKVCEEIISNQLSELVLFVFETSKKHGLYLNTVPFLYEKLTVNLIKALVPSNNVGDFYHKLVAELIDMMFESFAAEYMREEVAQFRVNAQEKLIKWNEQILQREAETSLKILESVKIESKNDFLTSFKSVFAISSAKDPVSKENFTEMQAKAKILSENIRSLNKILSPEVVLEIINNATTSLNRLLTFKDFTIASLRNDIFLSTQEIFIDVMDTIGIEHLTPGFEKALTYLQTYNPNSSTYTTQHNEKFAEPIVLFFDLINMADVIIQMVDFFYKEEMLNKKIVKHENSILNPSLQSKKKT